MLSFLVSFVSSEHRVLDLQKFVDGHWNATGGFLEEDGTFIPEDFFLNVTFETDENDNNTFYGKMTGLADGKNLELKISIGKENNQTFKIEKVIFPKTFLLASGEMEYGERNMPHAFGKWANESQHFKISVTSGVAFELTIFRTGQKRADIYRFLKTPKPVIPSVWTALRAPLFVFFFIIIYKIQSARQMIREEKAAKASKAKGNEKAQNKKKED